MANNSVIADLKTHFADLEDPRSGPAQQHVFLDILVIAISAIICGADAWTEIEAFGKARQAWLSQFLELPNGIPSHDTFGRVFRHLDPVQFETCFSQWIHAVQTLTRGQVIAVDGKCLRGSYDRVDRKAAIYLVSAWATENEVVLGQLKVADKSNEITAIPELLRLLDVQGCLVSIDAMGTQRAIATQIVEQGGDYLLAVKDNQRHLREDIQNLFIWADHMEYAGLQYAHCGTTHKGHGRIERRECWTLSDPSCICMLPDGKDWTQLQTVVRVRFKRTLRGQTSEEERYYISSLAHHGEATAAQVLNAVRHHWGIENKLHWVLDMAFREDACRVRKDHGDENLAILRRIALNRLRQDTRTKLGVHGKRLKAAWDTPYLEQLLGIQMQ